MGSPSLEVSQSRGDVALRDVGGGHCGGGLMVELDDLSGLLQFSFYDSMILFYDSMILINTCHCSCAPTDKC